MSQSQTYQRQEVTTLLERLAEPPHSLIVVAGPRQVGKTALVRYALASYPRDRYRFVAVDQADDTGILDLSATEIDIQAQDFGPRDVAWLVRQWQRARVAGAVEVQRQGCVQRGGLSEGLIDIGCNNIPG